jgi:Low-density lipoprotein receptor domain class A
MRLNWKKLTVNFVYSATVSTWINLPVDGYVCEECKENEFQCFESGRCLASEVRCNDRIDCADGSDELGCS